MKKGGRGVREYGIKGAQRYGGRDGVYVIIRFDFVANPIEVFYNNIDDETIRVFHVMALRDKTAALMN